MTLLAAAPAAPWGLLVIVAAIVAMCLLDRLPMRAFYSRRAFEPPRPLTYTEQAERLAELEASQEPPLSGELYRPRRELGGPSGRDLERWG